jgi:hypothetical protein
LKQYLLTRSEREFLRGTLEQVVPPGFVIFPQMRLANFIYVQKGTPNWWGHFGRLNACVDFVLFEERLLIPRLVIELDDKSHDRRERQDRDEFVDAVMGYVGLPILHIQRQPGYDAEALGRAIRERLGVGE